MYVEVRPNHPLSLRQLRVGGHRNLRGTWMRPTKGRENLEEIVYHFTNIPHTPADYGNSCSNHSSRTESDTVTEYNGIFIACCVSGSGVMPAFVSFD